VYKILDPKATRFGLVVKKFGNILRILGSILNFVIKKLTLVADPEILFNGGLKNITINTIFK
jgi:hypothetical protein